MEKKKKGKVFTKSIQFIIVSLLAAVAFCRGPKSQWVMIGIFALWGGYVLISLISVIGKGLVKKYSGVLRERSDSEARLQFANIQETLAEHGKALLRHVECRISEKLKVTFPEATWEWRMDQPLRLAVNGGTGRIRLWNAGGYNYADVTIDQYARMKFYMMNVSELSEAATVPAETTPVETPEDTSVSAETEPIVDVGAWFNLLGKKALDEVITELNAHGHSKLFIKESGDIFITDKKGTEIKQDTLADMPGRKYWPQLLTLLVGVGLSCSAGDDKLLLSW